MPHETSIAKGHMLQTSNFYVMTNSNMWVVLVDQLTPEEEAYSQCFDKGGACRGRKLIGRNCVDLIVGGCR